MKVIKLNLRDYEVMKADGNGGSVKAPYNVRESIIRHLLPSDTSLDQKEALDRYSLAQKIRESEDIEILIGEKEYNLIRNAYGQQGKISFDDVEIIRRILGTKEIEVIETNISQNFQKSKTLNKEYQKPIRRGEHPLSIIPKLVEACLFLGGLYYGIFLLDNYKRYDDLGKAVDVTLNMVAKDMHSLFGITPRKRDLKERVNDFFR